MAILSLERNQICSNCVMDTSDVKITFDHDGVCDHCRNFSALNLHRWQANLEGDAKRELLKTIQHIKITRRNEQYDCLIGMSGGADSSYMLHLAVHEFGLRPLVFHVDAGWNSQRALENIRAMVDYLDLDLHVTVIDWESMRKLQLAFFNAGVSDLDTPQDHAFFSTMYKYANQSGIKYILNGGNVSTESVCVPLDWMYYASDVRQLKAIYRNTYAEPLGHFPLSSAFYHKLYLRYARGVKVVKLLDHIPYVKASAEKELGDIYGWKKFKEKHFESTFTRFNEGYWLPTRFGFDLRKTTYSSLILTGQMTRSDALAKLQVPSLEKNEVRIEKRYILNKLRISEDQLAKYMSMPKSHFSDFPNSYPLYKLGSKVLRGLGVEASVSR